MNNPLKFKPILSPHPSIPKLTHCLQIVIPVHGQEDYLNLLAKSLVNNKSSSHTHGRFGALMALLTFGVFPRILIVDNASPSDVTTLFITRELREFSETYNLTGMYEVVRLDKNTGVTHAWNMGVRAGLEFGATAISFLNSDVILGETALINPFRAVFAADCAIAFPSHSEGDPCPFDWQLKSKSNARPYHVNHLIPESHLFGSAFTVDSRLFAEIGFFDPQFVLLCGDTDFSIRTRAVSRPMARLLHCDVHHHVSRTLRATPPSWTRQTCAEDRLRLIEKYPELYSKSIVNVSGPAPST
jgi:GT2 family glycosyltransferase